MSELSDYLLYGGPDRTKHYTAVGKFVTEYANAESAVHAVARSLSGLSDDKARIIFGGMRIGDIMDRVRSMMRLDGTDNQTYCDVDSCLSQLNAIADRRHRLVHRSSMFFDGKLLVSNVMTAKSRASAESEPFDIPEMEAMEWDCRVIYLRLMHVSNPEAFKAQFAEIIQEMHQAWRYKPAPQGTQNKRPQKAPATLKPPPRSSPA